MDDELRKLLDKHLSKDRPPQPTTTPPTDERPPDQPQTRYALIALPAGYIAFNVVGIVTENREPGVFVLLLMAIAAAAILQAFQSHITNQFYLNGARVQQAMLIFGGSFLLYIVAKDVPDATNIDLAIILLNGCILAALAFIAW